MEPVRDGGDDPIGDNPFHVLGLRPEATAIEVEREGQKWLSSLALGLTAAAIYATPAGPRPRTPERVRAAMAELRDPDRRILHELWAKLEPPADPHAGRESSGTDTAAGVGTGAVAGRRRRAAWPEALFALGWTRR